jgi:hypothetical protein
MCGEQGCDWLHSLHDSTKTLMISFVWPCFLGLWGPELWDSWLHCLDWSALWKCVQEEWRQETKEVGLKQCFLYLTCPLSRHLAKVERIFLTARVISLFCFLWPVPAACLLGKWSALYQQPSTATCLRTTTPQLLLHIKFSPWEHCAQRISVRGQKNHTSPSIF